MELIYKALTRFFLETFCFAGIVACVVLMMLLYEPPVPPPEQRNYSQSSVMPSERTFTESWLLEEGK